MVSGRLLRDLRTFAAVRNWSWLNQRMFEESLPTRASCEILCTKCAGVCSFAEVQSFEWRIVDSERASAHRGHSCASALMGRVRQKLAPPGELFAAHKRPPCFSTMVWLIRSPIPVPWLLVVKNALKIWSAGCRGSPTPVSLTDT